MKGRPLTLVGVTGFEPAASSSRTTRATKLRHTPLPTPIIAVAQEGKGTGDKS